MSAPEELERDFPLARLTTVRTGGRGEFFARVGDSERLLELLAWAGAAGVGGDITNAREPPAFFRAVKK